MIGAARPGVKVGEGITGEVRGCHFAVLMYAKNQVYFGDFGDFKGLYMKFHTDFADPTPNSKNLYEKSNTIRIFDRQTLGCMRKIE